MRKWHSFTDCEPNKDINEALMHSYSLLFISKCVRGRDNKNKTLAGFPNVLEATDCVNVAMK